MAWFLGFLSGSWTWYGAAALAAGGLGFLGYSRGNVKWIAVGLVLGALLAYVGTLHGQVALRDSSIATLTATNATLTADLGVQKASVARLESSLTTFVTAGRRAKDNSRMWQKKFEESQKQVSDTTTFLNGFIRRTNEGDCDAAKRLLLDYPR